MNNEAPKPNLYVWWFVAGLPLGLVVMGALSFIFYFHKRHQRETPQPSRFAAMMRKDVSMDDFTRYQRVFADIGERTLNKPENLGAAASFIESTMGIDNMGYAVTRREFPIQGKSVASIEAELHGTKRPRDLVLLIARYDGKNTREIAALLCVANALTGTPVASTVRFVALAVGNDEDQKNNGAVLYRDWINRSEFDAVTVVMDETSLENAVIKTALKEKATAFVGLPLTQAISFDELKQCEAIISKLADGK